MQDNAKHAWHCVLMQRGSKVQTTKGRAGAGGRRQEAGGRGQEQGRGAGAVGASHGRNRTHTPLILISAYTGTHHTRISAYMMTNADEHICHLV